MMIHHTIVVILTNIFKSYLSLALSLFGKLKRCAAVGDYQIERGQMRATKL